MNIVSEAKEKKIATSAKKAVVARSPFKIPGGKTGLLPELRTRVSPSFDRYFEPFLGGGALFWDLAARGLLRPGKVVLSDWNAMVTRTFRVLRDDVDALCDRLRVMPMTKDHFLAIRSVTPEARNAMSDVELAAWFLYLNRTAVNGIFRVNRAGVFNVPWAGYPNPRVLHEELFRACSATLRSLKVEIHRRPFQTILDHARKGDFVYADPPYLPISKTSNFTAYTKDGFGYDAHVRLRDVSRELKERGAFVMISNADAPVVRELYEDFTIDVVHARRSVNTKGDGRAPIQELIIR